MTSEAQKRATAKYRAKNPMVQRVITFQPSQADELAHLDAHENRSGYIRQLIADDMRPHLGADATERYRSWLEAKDGDTWTECLKAFEKLSGYRPGGSGQ